MIQCHVFNSFARLDLRSGGPYILSQFVGGMAAPLFLLMAGMTFAFQMESSERRQPLRLARWMASLRRGGFVLGVALTFRLTNCLGSLGPNMWNEIGKVDILNCMGVAMLLFSPLAMASHAARVRMGAALGLAIALLTPILANLSWDGAPVLLRHYLVPSGMGGQFAQFPCAAYVGFGLALGGIVRRAAPERMERVMQWLALGGGALLMTAHYFANVPYSPYPVSNFWIDSPALVIIRLGIMMAVLSGCWVWTSYVAGAGWNWMLCLGRNSLLVYWVHVMLVYCNWAKPLKRSLTIPQTALATAVVTALMVGLAAAWMAWKRYRADREAARTIVLDQEQRAS
jgi:hypothetical protein